MYGKDKCGKTSLLKHIQLFHTKNYSYTGIIPFYIDYKDYENIDSSTQKPVGTLRIPSFLIHAENQVCSRSILKRSVDRFTKEMSAILEKNPAICSDLGFSIENLDHIELWAATELEFWVSSPDERINQDRLTVSENLKEQYWKIGLQTKH